MLHCWTYSAKNDLVLRIEFYVIIISVVSECNSLTLRTVGIYLYVSYSCWLTNGNDSTCIEISCVLNEHMQLMVVKIFL